MLTRKRHLWAPKSDDFATSADDVGDKRLTDLWDAQTNADNDSLK